MAMIKHGAGQITNTYNIKIKPDVKVNIETLSGDALGDIVVEVHRPTITGNISDLPEPLDLKRKSEHPPKGE